MDVPQCNISHSYTIPTKCIIYQSHNPVLIFILGNETCDLARKVQGRNVILSHHLTNIILQLKISAYPKSFHLHKTLTTLIPSVTNTEPC